MPSRLGKTNNSSCCVNTTLQTKKKQKDKINIQSLNCSQSESVLFFISRCEVTLSGKKVCYHYINMIVVCPSVCALRKVSGNDLT